MCPQASPLNISHPPRQQNPLRRFWSEERGVAAVEVALIAPPFLLFIMAILQVALVFVATLSLDNAMTNASRQIRTGQAQNANLSREDFRALVCNGITAVIACDANLLVDVQALPTFGPVSLAWPVRPDGTWENAPAFAPGGSGQVVVVRAFYQYPVWLPWVGSLMQDLPNGRRLLTSAAAFRNEPF